MPYLILGLGFVVGVYLILRGTSGMAKQRAAKIIGTLIGLGLLGALLYLAATRGGAALWMALFFLLPAFLRWRSAKRFFRNLGGPSPGQSSDVETRYLRMRLDHDTGVLDGTVLEDDFAGRRLGEMALEELLALLRVCRVEDDESATVLEAYLDRVRGAAWRGGDDEGDAGDAGGSHWGRGRSRSGGGSMTREEAYEILGLKPGASDAEIKRAHHSMMQKMHPDHGGSNYLATKINEAKDVLLGG
jgi:hypothetical protein